MSDQIKRKETQEVFVVSQKTSTFTDTGNAISEVLIEYGDIHISVKKHSKGQPKITVHTFGKVPEMTIFAKITKKQESHKGALWTTIKGKDSQ